MPAILQFIEKAGLAGVFDDRATKVMGQAFDAACKDLHDTGQPDLVYEVIASRIIEAAKSGERDPEKLRDWALTSLSETEALASSLRINEPATDVNGPPTEAALIVPNALAALALIEADRSRFSAPESDE
jgi:hypothetical protein